MATETLSQNVEKITPQCELQPKSTWNRFLDRINRPDIAEKLTLKSPWVFFTAECYDPEKGLYGAGGLGILADDINRTTYHISAPLLTITPFYPQNWHQHIDRSLNQIEIREKHKPSEYNYKDTKQKIILKTLGRAGLETTDIEIWQKDNLIVLYNSKIGEVYSGSPFSDHRLFQQMVGGWVGMQAILDQKIDPGVIQLNEGSSVFAALAYMDHLVSKGETIDDALAHTRTKTFLTNHTLVPAALNRFNGKQLNKYLYPNIKSREVQKWINRQLLDSPGHTLDLGDLALELAGKQNGVSVLHAEIASKNFIGPDGKPVHFDPVTNGIDQHWINRVFFEMHQDIGVYDEFGLTTDNLLEAVARLRYTSLKETKAIVRANLKEYLKGRLDQYGNSIIIPPDASIAVWARRFADYKRPELILSDPNRLVDLLDESNTYLIMAGRAHPDDKIMKQKINKLLKIIDKNERLKKRVIFVQNYDPELAEQLNAGADVAINTPIVGNEACGTSIFKLIANHTLVVSTRDGGLADAPKNSFIEITGDNEPEEIESLYRQFEYALNLLKPENESAWLDQDIRQFAGLANYISGERMIVDYLKFIFPEQTISQNQILYTHQN